MIEPSNAELSELPDCSRQYIADLEVENEQLERGNAELLAALEAVRGLAEVSQDYQLALIARNAIAKATSLRSNP